MTKKNGKRRAEVRHPNQLLPSQPDHVGLVRAIEDRFLDLCALHQRLRGTELRIPDVVKPDAVRWRMVRRRHLVGDFRHTEAEWRSVNEFAQWTLDLNSELRGQPRTTFDRIPA